MFRMDTSEIAGPISGYFISSIIAAVAGIYLFTTKRAIFDLSESTFVITILGAILLFCGYLCLKNAYLIDGLSTILQAVVVISMSVCYIAGTYFFGDILHVVIAIAFIAIAVMCFFVFEDLVMAANILWAILMVVSMDVWNTDLSYVLGAVCIGIFIIDAIMFYKDWVTMSSLAAGTESKLERK